MREGDRTAAGQLPLKSAALWGGELERNGAAWPGRLSQFARVRLALQQAAALPLQLLALPLLPEESLQFLPALQQAAALPLQLA